MAKEKKDLKILIVDDDEKDLKLLEIKLSQLGFSNVIKAEGGKEALELAREHLPDLILLDIAMPGLDGGQVRHLLDENPKTKDIFTVFISSFVTDEETKRLEGMIRGHLIIAKPYTSDKLSEVINKASVHYYWKDKRNSSAT